MEVAERWGVVSPADVRRGGGGGAGGGRGEGKKTLHSLDKAIVIPMLQQCYPLYLFERCYST